MIQCQYRGMMTNQYIVTDGYTTLILECCTGIDEYMLANGNIQPTIRIEWCNQMKRWIIRSLD